MIGKTNFKSSGGSVSSNTDIPIAYEIFRVYSSNTSNYTRSILENGYYLAFMTKVSSSNTITSTGTVTNVYDCGNYSSGLLIKKIKANKGDTITFGLSHDSDYYMSYGLYQLNKDISFPSSSTYTWKDNDMDDNSMNNFATYSSGDTSICFSAIYSSNWDSQGWEYFNDYSCLNSYSSILDGSYSSMFLHIWKFNQQATSKGYFYSIPDDDSFVAMVWFNITGCY